LDDGRRMETDGGYLEDEDRWIVDERLRQPDRLPVPLGEVAEEETFAEPQPADVEDALERHGDVPAPEPLQLRDEAEIARHGHVVVEGRVLGKVADPPADLGRLLEDVEAVDAHRAARRRQKAGD